VLKILYIIINIIYMPFEKGNQLGSNAVSGFNRRPMRMSKTASEKAILKLAKTFSEYDQKKILDTMYKEAPHVWMSYKMKNDEMLARLDEHKYAKELNALKFALEQSKEAGEGRTITISYSKDNDVQDADVVG
jgi:hypothetical protein